MKRRTLVGGIAAAAAAAAAPRDRITPTDWHERRQPAEQALRRDHRHRPPPRRATPHRGTGHRACRRSTQPPERGQCHAARTQQFVRLRSSIPLLRDVGGHRRPALRGREGAHARGPGPCGDVGRPGDQVPHLESRWHHVPAHGPPPRRRDRRQRRCSQPASHPP